jgi:hypothetical protein
LNLELRNSRKEGGGNLEINKRGRELKGRILRVITLEDKKRYTMHFLTGGSKYEDELL